MKHLGPLAGTILLVGIAATIAGPVVTAGLNAQIDAAQILVYMEEVRNETGVPGMSVAIAAGNEIILSEGVGFAELDNKVPATGKTALQVNALPFDSAKYGMAIAQMLAAAK